MNKTWLKSVSQHKAERKRAGIDYALLLWNSGKTPEEIAQMADDESGSFAVGMRLQAECLGTDDPLRGRK